MNNIPFVKKNEIFIIIFIVILGILGLFLQKNFSAGAVAQIYFDGKLEKEISLSKDCIFDIKDFEFEIKDGAIRVAKSPCRNKICVHTGFISNPAQTIACLPEKMLVKIKGKEKGIDLVVG